MPLKLLDSDFELPLRWDIFEPDDSEPRLGAFMSDPDEVTESGLALDTNKKRPTTTNVRRGDILFEFVAFGVYSPNAYG